MGKYMVFSDFHAHPFEQFAKSVTIEVAGIQFHTTDRVQRQVEALKQIYHEANEENADVIFAGDFFHARASVPTQIFNIMFLTMQQLTHKYSDVHSYFIAGNHDQVDNTRVPSNSIQTFDVLPNVTVASEPSSIVSDAGDMLYMIPFSTDTDFIKSMVDVYVEHAENDQDTGILIAHLGIDGALSGNYSHRLGGEFSVDDLRPDVFDVGIFGHYHKRQTLTEDGRYFYVGNTVPKDFNDDESKGYYVVDTEADHGNAIDIEYRPLNNPVFLTVTDPGKYTEEELEKNYTKFRVDEETAAKLSHYGDDTETSIVETQRKYENKSRIRIEEDSTENDIIKSVCEEIAPGNENVKKLSLNIFHS